MDGTFTDKIHKLDVRVYYEDTDFSGVVYHANYLKFAERGRSSFLRLAGVIHSDLLAHEPPLAFVVCAMNKARPDLCNKLHERTLSLFRPFSICKLF